MMWHEMLECVLATIITGLIVGFLTQLIVWLELSKEGNGK